MDHQGNGRHKSTTLHSDSNHDGAAGSNGFSGGNGKGLSTVRLDLATKLSLMASLIFACGPDGTTPESAVADAVHINDLCETRAKTLKQKQAA